MNKGSLQSDETTPWDELRMTQEDARMTPGFSKTFYGIVSFPLNST